MNDEYGFPFVDDDSVIPMNRRKRKNRTPKNLTMMLAEKKKTKEGKEDGSYYKGTNSRVKPPDQPLNILLIHLASTYKVDGSNTIGPVVGLESFKDGIVLGSFNGLVAFYRRCPDGRRSDEDFCLLNPHTGNENSVKLDSPISTLWDVKNHMLGLCHDSVNDEYKAVILYSKDRRFQRFTVADFKRKRSVVKIQHGLPYFKAFPSGPIGTIVKGVPNWICEFDKGCLIYYFDSKTEEFLLGPGLPDRSVICRLGSLDGKLIASHAAPQRGTLFWALHETDGSYSWKCLFVLPELVCSFSTLSWMTRDVELLVHDADSRLTVI